ncbi:MAG: RluA family pseudouridine synthase [Candidatus Omnitrophota bacterium]
MEDLKFVITRDEAGARVDKYLADKLGEDYSRTYVKYLMDNGAVHVNAASVKPHYAIREGDQVECVLLPSPDIDHVIPENIPIEIFYEDDDIIVVNKPAGMVVHPAAGNKTGTLVNALLYHCKTLPETGDELRPGIVHRLDKDTSGVIVIAKSARAHSSLSEQFQNRAVKKSYLAIVKGRVEMDNGIINVPVARHSVDRKKMAVEFSGGKEAVTVYHVLRRYKNFTLLRLDLLTGRTHQIRVHMKYLGCPVLGDKKYGTAPGIDRQALHAEKLAFLHPDTGKLMEFTSPLPDDMRGLLEQGDNAPV